MNNDYILIGILAKKLNKDRNTILRHLRNSNFQLYEEKKGKILNIYIHKNDEEKITNFLNNSKDYHSGYTQNDLKLKNKGLLSINDICKKLNKGRCTISTVIKYLNILPFTVSNNHKFYSNNDFIKIEEFYKTHSNYEKFLAKEMRIKKYGENPYKNRNEKTIKTNIEKYGKNYKEIFLQKMKQSIKEKHGDENYRNIEKTKETLHKNRLKFCKENDCSIFSEIFKTNIEHSWSTLSYCLDKLNIKPIYHKSVIYIKNSDVELLKNELKNIKYSHESIGEKQIVSFIKELGVNIEENNREILNGKELDIYIPSKKVAIEFDGLYYYSSKFTNKNYHLNKTIACEEKGIRLIHIFEDEWYDKQEICKSIIKSSLGIYNKKIYARKCIAKSIDKNIFDKFCNENHIQGSCVSSDSFGLFYNNELIQVVGFNKSRFSKNEIELVRMCTKLNTQVIGGFSKLMNFYGKKCISYVDRRLFNGKGYSSSGFKLLKINPPNYYYTKNLSRFYRMNFTKKNIAKKFPNEYDSNLTEEENMMKLNYYRIYDCGTIKVEWNKE